MYSPETYASKKFTSLSRDNSTEVPRRRNKATPAAPYRHLTVGNQARRKHGGVDKAH
jgi:hypothetical protein